MLEHSEIVQESRIILPEGRVEFITRDGRVEFITRDGRVWLITDGRVTEKPNTQSEFLVVATFTEIDRSKFRRFLDESFPDLGGPQLEALSNVCLAAEEFFLGINVTDELVKTVIGHENLCSNAWIEASDRCNLISDISMLRAAISDKESIRVHLPSFMLKEAFEEGKTLKTKLFEWKGTRNGKLIRKGPLEKELRGPEENELGGSEDEYCKQPRTSKLFWEIQAAAVTLEKNLSRGSDGTIRLIKWRGYHDVQFVQKCSNYGNIDAELKLVKWLSHPHIVYSFGEPCDGLESSYFMEYMPYNLTIAIREAVNRGNVPPFSHHESVCILLQIAEAMRYMHQENVVHCDLKCDNILISAISTPDNAVQNLVKVTDFGSAKVRNASGRFIAGNGTTAYVAPEALKQREDKEPIGEPDKIDVYSFSIVAFVVLTGEDKYIKRSSKQFKEGVIEGTVRPLLSEACQFDKKLIQNEELISLIARCWDKDPSERPAFVKICEELNTVVQVVQKQEQMLQSNSPHQGDSVNGTSSAPEGHAFCLEFLSVVRSSISWLWQ